MSPSGNVKLLLAVSERLASGDFDPFAPLPAITHPSYLRTPQKAVQLHTEADRKHQVKVVWDGYYDTWSGQAAIVIQRWWRAVSQQRVRQRLKSGHLSRGAGRRETAAVVIQRHVRGWLVRSSFCEYFEDVRDAANTFKSVWRMLCAKRKLKVLRKLYIKQTDAAIVIQRFVRGWLVRNRRKQALLAPKHAAATVIQACWRSYKARRRLAWLRIQRQKAESYRERSSAATCIQRWIRGFLTRTHHQRLRAEAGEHLLGWENNTSRSSSQASITPPMPATIRATWGPHSYSSPSPPHLLAVPAPSPSSLCATAPPPQVVRARPSGLRMKLDPEAARRPVPGAPQEVQRALAEAVAAAAEGGRERKGRLLAASRSQTARGSGAHLVQGPPPGCDGAAGAEASSNGSEGAESSTPSSPLRASLPCTSPKPTAPQSRARGTVNANCKLATSVSVPSLSHSGPGPAPASSAATPITVPMSSSLLPRTIRTSITTTPAPLGHSPTRTCPQVPNAFKPVVLVPYKVTTTKAHDKDRDREAPKSLVAALQAEHNIASPTSPSSSLPPKKPLTQQLDLPAPPAQASNGHPAAAAPSPPSSGGSGAVQRSSASAVSINSLQRGLPSASPAGRAAALRAAASLPLASTTYSSTTDTQTILAAASALGMTPLVNSAKHGSGKQSRTPSKGGHGGAGAGGDSANGVAGRRGKMLGRKLLHDQALNLKRVVGLL